MFICAAGKASFMCVMAGVVKPYLQESNDGDVTGNGILLYRFLNVGEIPILVTIVCTVSYIRHLYYSGVLIWYLCMA